MFDLKDPTSWVWMGPFLCYVVAIAVLAVFFDLRHTFWHKRNLWEEYAWPKGVLGAICFIPVAYWANAHGYWHDVGKEGKQLVEFLCVMLPFMVAAYGLMIKANIRPTPTNNAMLLLLGGLVGAVAGTPAASLVFTMMLLTMNASRRHVMHIWIFIIVAVSNVPGGLLPVSTPLVVGMQAEGGIPFGWFASNLFWPWLTSQLCVTAGFWLVDLYQFSREDDVVRLGARDQFGEVIVTGEKKPLMEWSGAGNIVVLLCMTALVLMPFPDHLWFIRSLALVALAGVAWTVPGATEARRLNRFNTMPFKEITYVFASIFALLAPCFVVLKERGGELGMTTNTQYFVVTGGLSSTLDNAPTYLLMLALGGKVNAVGGEPLTPEQLAHAKASLVMAISLGAAFWGCLTYIGNGPNLAVRSIVAGSGRPMPNFLVYIPLAALIAVPLVFLPTWFFFIK